MVGLMRYISTISRCAVQYRGEKLAGYGLNGYQSGYILNVCRKPGITQDQLAQQIHVNRSNVTRQLALLEENGFVERRQSESDKRATEVYPTKKAIAVLPEVREVLDRWNEYLTDGFTDEERDFLDRLLARVAQKAENYVTGMGKEA